METTSPPGLADRVAAERNAMRALLKAAPVADGTAVDRLQAARDGTDGNV